MKNTVLIISTTILGVLVLMIVMTINGRMNRSMEITSNLSSVVEEAVENMALEPKYTIENTSTFVADLTEYLSMTIDAVSDVKVDVLKVDKERGMLSIRATLVFKHPNGNEGTVSHETLAIFNKMVGEEKEQHRVTFYVGSDIHKEYIVYDGTVLPPPQNPALTEGTFQGWVNADGSAVDFSKPITEGVVYYASIG